MYVFRHILEYSDWNGRKEIIRKLPQIALVCLCGFPMKDRGRLSLNSVHLQTERNLSFCPDLHTVQALWKSTRDFNIRLNLFNFCVKFLSFKFHYTIPV